MTIQQDNRYSVEVYNGNVLITTMQVKAKDNAEASQKALHEFFEDINVKIKKAYN